MRRVRMHTARWRELYPPLSDKIAVVFEVTRPHYMPEGEVRVVDPDGYGLLIGQHE